MAYNKYKNKASEEPCTYGFKHKSMLELAVCNHYFWQEKTGKLKVEAHEDKIELSEAKIIYKPDLKCTHPNGEVFWVEAKGAETADWRNKKKLWRVYGPGPLYIYKGYYKKFYLDEIVTPQKYVSQEMKDRLSDELEA